MSLYWIEGKLVSVPQRMPEAPQGVARAQAMAEERAAYPVLTVEQAAAKIASMDLSLSLLERSRQAVERMLAGQGDAAEPELIALQHDLVAAAAQRRKFLTQQ